MTASSKTRATAIGSSIIAIAVFIAAILQAASPSVVLAYSPSVSTTGYPGPGDTIAVSGGGWPAQHTLNISYDGTQLATAVVRLQEGIVGPPIGAFQAPLTIPTATTTGSHVIQVTDPDTGLTQQTTIVVKAEWRQFGFTAAGARYNPYETTIGTGNVGQLSLAWSNNTGYTGPVMPAAAEDDLLFVNQAAHYLTNLNATTGKQLWQDYPTDTESQPVVANGIAYISDLRFSAYSVATGTLLWQSSYQVFDANPVLANGLIYAAWQGGNGGVSAYAQAGCGQMTCDPVWTYTTSGAANYYYGTPAVANGHVYLGGNQLTVLDAKTGALQWTAAIASGETIQAPIVDKGMVFVAADSTYNGGTFYAFNAAGCGQATCTPLWTVHNASGWGNSPAAANDVVYIGGKDKMLYAFAEAGCGAATCAPLWEGVAPGQVLTPPAIANGVIYVSSWYPGDALAFNATGCGSASCAPMWTYDLHANYVDAPPTIANGMLYISDDSGMLYAFHLPNTSLACQGASIGAIPRTACTSHPLHAARMP